MLLLKGFCLIVPLRATRRDQKIFDSDFAVCILTPHTVQVFKVNFKSQSSRLKIRNRNRIRKYLSVVIRSVDGFE